ncbi:hypothetical protein [Methanobacterium virus PhiF1]|nr:hypothetical protein [Methanobacterium virus PhiF1]
MAGYGDESFLAGYLLYHPEYLLCFFYDITYILHSVSPPLLSYLAPRVFKGFAPVSLPSMHPRPPRFPGNVSRRSGSFHGRRPSTLTACNGRFRLSMEHLRAPYDAESHRRYDT